MCYEKRDTEQARACFERDQRKDDYISRKALLAEYDRVHVGPPGGARKLIEEAPAADVQTVVHCRDCKHITPAEGGLPLCALHNIARAYNDFCSDGARMDGV